MATGRADPGARINRICVGCRPTGDAVMMDADQAGFRIQATTGETVPERKPRPEQCVFPSC